jgi:hypothetical protein
VLVIQPLKNPADFNGRLEVRLSGLQNGKPWVAALPRQPAAQIPPVRARQRCVRPPTNPGQGRHRQGVGWGSGQGHADHQVIVGMYPESIHRPVHVQQKKQPPIKSLIAEGTEIEGHLHFTEGLRVDGAIIGNVQARPESASILVISETAGRDR